MTEIFKHVQSPLPVSGIRRSHPGVWSRLVARYESTNQPRGIGMTDVTDCD
jgi:hypothetical protein